MPHLTEALLKGPGRNPKLFFRPFPFKEILPLKLKNRVSGKADKTANSNCLHEMSILMACLKEKNYKEQECTKEVENFKNCANNFYTEFNKRKELDRAGITPGAKQLKARHLDTLFEQYPQPK